MTARYSSVLTIGSANVEPEHADVEPDDHLDLARRPVVSRSLRQAVIPRMPHA
jgi:hypothetical protein